MCRNHKRSLTSSKRQQRVPWLRIKKSSQPLPLQTRALRTTGFDEAVLYHPRRIHLKLPATIGSVSEPVSSPLSPPSFDPTLMRFRLCGLHQSVSQFVVGRQSFFWGDFPLARDQDFWNRSTHAVFITDSPKHSFADTGSRCWPV